MSIPKSAIEAAAKAIADEIGHGMGEKYFDHARAALNAALPYIRDQALEEAARSIIDNRPSTFKARNGKRCSIEDDNGEQCWIVSFEDMDVLEIALKPQHQKGGDV